MVCKLRTIVFFSLTEAGNKTIHALQKSSVQKISGTIPLQSIEFEKFLVSRECSIGPSQDSNILD